MSSHRSQSVLRGYVVFMLAIRQREEGLGDRVHSCPYSASHGQDVNVAKNIFSRGWPRWKGCTGTKQHSVYLRIRVRIQPDL